VYLRSSSALRAQGRSSWRDMGLRPQLRLGQAGVQVHKKIRREASGTDRVVIGDGCFEGDVSSSSESLPSGRAPDLTEHYLKELAAHGQAEPKNPNTQKHPQYERGIHSDVLGSLYDLHQRGSTLTGRCAGTECHYALALVFDLDGI